ncbi:MAG TPA: hypothetical protein VM553_09040 [Dongiaceae bacterium]|nr:hypothetical protein [Dongiaceae bacterium]
MNLFATEIPDVIYSSKRHIGRSVLGITLVTLLTACVLMLCAGQAQASSTLGQPRDIHYPVYAPSPAKQTSAEMDAKSAGCLSCHTSTDQPSMHASEGVKLGCVDCHGGNAAISRNASDAPGSDAYKKALNDAHVQPLYPQAWHYPSSANPERSYSLLNHESPEFIRFINPSDYRVVEEACGACHMPAIEATRRSLMSTGAMLWGGAAYNNGILPFKNYMLGEAYTRDGEPASITNPIEPTPEMKAMGVLSALAPMPAWETVMPGDIFRVFERGGRNIQSLFPETALPNVAGNIQRLEEPGRPDIKQSNRGPGTGQRISVPLINIHKTRLNDPFMWFMGTNDQPGDYRHSGCAGCHVIYANDRDPRHSGPYAKFGHGGLTQTVDPTIAKDKTGHPLQHSFTRSIPSSQCMICHMHQPNMFMNTFLGYTMWDYESDAPFMWPEKQKYPSHEEQRKILDRNPEAAAVRGKWGDLDFLKNVSALNPQLKDTQFADYHGHGWNFRAIFKRDRKGHLLDEKGNVVSNDDPQKFKKAVHLSSVHVDKGMHCVDCHFSQDAHGNGHIYGEVAAAVEVDCVDCHGTAQAYPSLITSGPAALEGGQDLSLIRNPDGQKRFEWVNDKLMQRSVVTPGLEWEVSLVKDSVTQGNAHYNAKAARAKLVSTDTAQQTWNGKAAPNDLAHSNDKLECYACHTSWTTACGGCHLPIEANWKTQRHHYEGGETRNYATYNPQVARDDIFMLGLREPSSGGRVAPVRSTSALVLSSTNANREKIYIQQPPISASGYSSQAMNPHYPHTERKTETKTCSDCHVSVDNDNNAIMAQTLGYGTQFINLVGYNAWVGTQSSVTAVQVTEWDEPQAVIGSYLQRYAYPDFFMQHEDRNKTLPEAHSHSSGEVGCLQLRGEYLYAAEGDKGFRIYDVASIANKGVSQKIITAPFSELGHDAHVETQDASCVVLATTQPVQPSRIDNNKKLMLEDNLEQPFHPIYRYAFVTDRKEGLILVDIDSLADGEPRNNKMTRALTWNENGVLNGARYLVLGGYYGYVLTDTGLVVLNLNDPLHPQVASTLALNDARGADLQFRYLFVTDAEGLKVVDVTHPEQPVIVGNRIEMSDAHKVFVARTYAYVAAGANGLVIVDIEKPNAIKLYQQFTADGAISDARDVVVATTNASLFAYVADGKNGLKVLQLTAPDTQPNFYGFSPEPKPQLIARYATEAPALSLSQPLERDRAVDETGGQVAVFGRRGSRPFNQNEQKKLYLNGEGKVWTVRD